MTQQDVVTTPSKRVAIQELKRIRADGFRWIPCNNANVATNFFDVSLIFGGLDPTEAMFSGNPVIEDRIGVVMSWEHAKALKQLLERMIHEYESQNSTIREMQD